MELTNQEPQMQLINADKIVLSDEAKKERYHETKRRAWKKYRMNPINREKIRKIAIEYYHRKMKIDPVYKAKRQERAKKKQQMEMERRNSAHCIVSCK